MSDIALTASQRTSLISLQNTQKLSSRTQTRLSTGRQVNSVVDDAVNFFRAKTLSDRAADFDLKKTEIDQGISALNATLTAIESIDSLVKQLKGVSEAARSQSQSERTQATVQFTTISKQIFQLVEDASYQGLNLLTTSNSTLEVSFGTRTDSRLQVSGLNLTATASSAASVKNNLFSVSFFSAAGGGFRLTNLGLSSSGFSSFGANNSLAATSANKISQFLDKGISRLRGQAANLGSSVAVLQTRLDFTNAYVNELTVGSDKLTLADLNEEGASLVALQTRQQLGIQALSVSGQQQQAVLGLIG